MSYPLSSDVLNIRSAYVAAFPLWHGMPVDTPEQVALAEDRARQWVYGFQQQVAYSLPGQSYGSKRASATRPVTKDGLAQQTNGRLIVWDMLSGAGTGSPTLTENPSGEDITGQIFVPVAPANLLGLSQVPPGPTQPPVSTQRPYNEDYAIQFGLGCNEVYRQSGAPIDPGMVSVHSSRAAWDYYVKGLSWDDSYHKHINEFRREYGLGPV